MHGAESILYYILLVISLLALVWSVQFLVSSLHCAECRALLESFVVGARETVNASS